MTRRASHTVRQRTNPAPLCAHRVCTRCVQAVYALCMPDFFEGDPHGKL